MTTAKLNDDLKALERTFKVIGLHSPSEMAAHHIDDTTAIVAIDAIRCTTTTSSIIAAGAEDLRILVKREDDALATVVADHEKRGTGRPLVIGGEKHGTAIPGGEFGNSALEVPSDLTGRSVVFFSTNAGRAVEAITNIVKPNSGAAVFLASMRNLDLVAETITIRGYQRLVIASGGFYERLSLEDAVAGGRIIRLLGFPETSMDDGALSMVALADRYSNDDELVDVLRNNRIGKALCHYGRKADIAAAITGEGIAPSMRAAMAGTVGQLAWIENTPVFIESNTNTKEEKCKKPA